MGIASKIEKLRAIDVDRLIDDTFKECEGDIIRMNQSQLYDKGQIDVVNPSVRERYAPATIAQKAKKARWPKTEFVTLRWAGDLYDKMKLIIFRDYVIVATDDLKWANWLEPNPRFGRALGLTDESKSELRDLFKEKITKKIMI